MTAIYAMAIALNVILRGRQPASLVLIAVLAVAAVWVYGDARRLAFKSPAVCALATLLVPITGYGVYLWTRHDAAQRA